MDGGPNRSPNVLTILTALRELSKERLKTVLSGDHGTDDDFGSDDEWRLEDHNDLSASDSDPESKAGGDGSSDSDPESKAGGDGASDSDPESKAGGDGAIDSDPEFKAGGDGASDSDPDSKSRGDGASDDDSDATGNCIDLSASVQEIRELLPLFTPWEMNDAVRREKQRTRPRTSLIKMLAAAATRAGSAPAGTARKKTRPRRQQGPQKSRTGRSANLAIHKPAKRRTCKPFWKQTAAAFILVLLSAAFHMLPPISLRPLPLGKTRTAPASSVHFSVGGMPLPATTIPIAFVLLGYLCVHGAGLAIERANLLRPTARLLRLFAPREAHLRRLVVNCPSKSGKWVAASSGFWRGGSVAAVVLFVLSCALYMNPTATVVRIGTQPPRANQTTAYSSVRVTPASTFYLPVPATGVLITAAVLCAAGVACRLNCRRKSPANIAATGVRAMPWDKGRTQSQIHNQDNAWSWLRGPWLPPQLKSVFEVFVEDAEGGGQQNHTMEDVLAAFVVGELKQDGGLKV